MTEPWELAYIAVVQTMNEGSSKDGCDDSWKTKERRLHCLKAIRHATTALMQYEGVIPPDGENHLKLAVTRLAMCLYQEEECSPKPPAC